MNIHVHRVHMSLQGLSALAKKTAYLDKISVMNNVLEVWMEKWFVVTLIILSEQELLVRSGQIFKRTADNWAKSTKQKCIFLVTHLSYSHLIEVTWAGSRENNFHLYVEFSSKHLLACRWKVSLPMLARRRLDLQAGSVNVRSQETKHAYSELLESSQTVTKRRITARSFFLWFVGKATRRTTKQGHKSAVRFDRFGKTSVVWVRI